jgi:hypothetical protein
MIVEITGDIDGFSWYGDKIGKLYEVEEFIVPYQGIQIKAFKTESGDWILPCDCVVIEDIKNENQKRTINLRRR